VDKFRFLGFLPSKKSARRKSLEGLRSAAKAFIFYEAPHRLVEMLEDVLEVLGDRPAVVAREVTKVHEAFMRGPISEVLQALKKKPVRGEITVLLGTAAAEQPKVLPAQSIRKELEGVMAGQGLDEREALKVVARRRGISKSEAYRQWQTEKGRAPRSLS